MQDVSRDNYKERISPSVLNRLRMLLVLALIFLVLAIYHLVVDTSEWRWALIGLAMGMVIGGLLTIFDDYVWHEGEARVVRDTNVLATILLVLYIIFTISRNQILDDWITRPASLGMTTAWLSVGVMLVRIHRMRREITQVLKQQFMPKKS